MILNVPAIEAAMPMGHWPAGPSSPHSRPRSQDPWTVGRYEAEHATAHQLQQALLPKVPAELPGVSIGATYLPAEPGQDWRSRPRGRGRDGRGRDGRDLPAPAGRGTLEFSAVVRSRDSAWLARSGG